LGYFALQSTGTVTVKTVLPTQISKIFLTILNVQIPVWSKNALSIFQKNPKIFFLGEKSPKLATQLSKRYFISRDYPFKGTKTYLVPFPAGSFGYLIFDP
jgi:hypothetical protein